VEEIIFLQQMTMRVQFQRIKKKQLTIAMMRQHLFRK